MIAHRTRTTSEHSFQGAVRNIPLAQVTIEAGRLVEHVAHVGDFGDVPLAQVTIEAGS
jgi:hypothetical protein